MAQPTKRRRIAVKRDLTKHLFDMNIGVTDRPLASDSSTSSNSATVKKWWNGLKVKNVEGLQNVQARADAILASLSQEQKAQMKDRACSLGFSFCCSCQMQGYWSPSHNLGGALHVGLLMPNNPCWFRAFWSSTVWTLALCSFDHVTGLLPSSSGFQSSLSLSGYACLRLRFSAVSQYGLSSTSSNLGAKVTASIPSIVTEFFNYDATTICSICSASCRCRDFRTRPMVTKQDLLCWKCHYRYTSPTRCSLEKTSMFRTGTVCQCGAGYALSSYPWSSTWSCYCTIV